MRLQGMNSLTFMLYCVILLSEPKNWTSLQDLTILVPIKDIQDIEVNRVGGGVTPSNLPHHRYLPSLYTNQLLRDWY